MLTPHAPDLWSVPISRPFMGWAFGARMTMVRHDDKLWLISPVPIDDALAARIEKEGPVAYVVAPNLTHHTFAGDAAARFPDATVVGPRGLETKRKDITFAAFLDDLAAEDGELDGWDLNALRPMSIKGQKTLNECVFLHRSSRTLITTDLLLNIEDAKDFWTRSYLKFSGYNGAPVHSKLLKWVAWSDKASGRESLLRVLDEDWDRLILAHGSIVDTGGKDALRNAFAWLL